jgi:membrane associated rhomboid family serine protease
MDTNLAARSGRIASDRPPWATFLVGALCLLAFLATQFAGSLIAPAHEVWRHLRPDQVFHAAAFWRFALPATLLHTGPLHLAINLWCLWVFGPLFERRRGGLALLSLWVVVGYGAMGAETILGGLGRIGLSGFTYALLGAAMSHWRGFRASKRQARTGVVMLALVAWGVLERIHPIAPPSGIAHIAHVAGLILGVCVEGGLMALGRPSMAWEPWE